jgi:hypothetical protein
MTTEVTAWDVRGIQEEGRRRRQAEDDWIAAHAGALSASQIGGCLRREKLRLMGCPALPPTDAQMRRWRWGDMYQEEVYRNSLKAGRRPKRDTPIEVEIGGMVIRGMLDFQYTEAIVEVKTTAAWEMHRDFIPFQHLIQLGTYMYAQEYPGQLLYASWYQEWAFDFPAIPEVWEPWVQSVARLFADHAEDGALPFPCERRFCGGCPYRMSCPAEEPIGSTEPASELEQQVATRYLNARQMQSAAKKEEDAAKAWLIGMAEHRGFSPKAKGKGETCLIQLPDKGLVISRTPCLDLDERAIPAEIKAQYMTTRTKTTITTTKEQED